MEDPAERTDLSPPPTHARGGSPPGVKKLVRREDKSETTRRKAQLALFAPYGAAICCCFSFRPDPAPEGTVHKQHTRARAIVRVVFLVLEGGFGARQGISNRFRLVLRPILNALPPVTCADGERAHPYSWRKHVCA